MAQHLRFVLDGDDRLSPVLNGAGDASTRLHNRLNDDMAGNATAVRRFTTDANGRLRDLNGRFLSAADAAQVMGNGMPALVRRMGEVSSAGGDAAAALGKGGGGMGGGMLFAAAAGLSLLPALGAVVPMLAGAGLAAGTMKLGFAGIPEAVEASTKSKKEYAEALKKLPKPARDFTKELVSLKKEFGGIGKDIQKAMLPGFTRALKDARPVVDILGKSMTDLGGAFGDAAAGAGRMLKDSGFQADLRTNLSLGSGFIRDMTSALGPFTRSLLDFGAASGPTLKSLSDGLGGLLTQGLPGMFKGLETGIPGTAKMLDGLFSAINDILPAVGRLAGELGNTLGPVFGLQLQAGGSMIAGAFDLARGALIALRPVIRDIGYGWKTLLDVGRLIGPTFADIGLGILGSFSGVGDKINETAGPLQRLNVWVNDNKIGILEFARMFASGTMDIVGAAVVMAPQVIGGFRFMADGILSVIDGVVVGAAAAFGHLPLIGDKFKDAAKGFHEFKEGFISGLDTAEREANDFAATTLPKLAQGKLQMNINNWNSQLEAAKAKLKTVPPSKRAAVTATIEDLKNKIAQAKAHLGSINGKVATTYINTVYRRAEESVQRPFKRDGGDVPRFAAGGMPSGLLNGPGTGTSDSLPMWWASTGEYIVNARSTKKYRSLIEAINADTLGTGSGRGMGGAGSAVAAGLADGMTSSTGKVMAGARLMAAAVTAGVRAELEIASPSKKMTALAKDIGAGLIKGLTGSRSQIQSTAKDLAADIRTAFSGKKESSLLKYVDGQTKKLLTAAAARDKAVSAIAAARSFASEVTKGAADGAGLGNLGMQAEDVTAGGIKSGLAGKLAQIKQFTSYIALLAKRGLSKDLLRQVLSMGPEQGYAYASALVGADRATFASINSLQTQIGKSATSLGVWGADVLYDSGKNAGKGFLAGLTSQQTAIEAQMLRIAKGMDKAIRKALGIKSPSTVMAQLGAYSTEGLARGLVAGVPVLDRALDTVTGRVAGTRPVLGRPAAAGGGGGVVTVNVTINGATDPQATAREVEKVLAKYKRGRGGAGYNFG